ncbi:MAG: [FeFe] hydrogenase H-cluster radical SAM maturase HydG [Sedimentisphaerales bacterium]|nr:[FeFe] hydrogenase H-cluster radical SAM maturase HydG [Sedimentisphaerales bacterium]
MLDAKADLWRDKRRNEIIEWDKNNKWQDFIDDGKIWSILRERKKPEASEVIEIIEKARSNTTQGTMLSPDEVAVLINTEDPELWDRIYETADWIKQTVYGNRIVLFAPLYLSNTCVNNCAYCGFRQANKELERKALNHNEVEAEVNALVNVGHKRLIAVYGEHPDSDAEYICKTVKKIYTTRMGFGEIRRCNINAAPMFNEEYRNIKQIGIGTYQIFQETYHHDTYRQVHPAGTLKESYLWRLFGLHRAMEVGIDDVGLGVLFGLYDWRFELIGLLQHAKALENEFGVGPHTISYPRLVYAENAPLATRSKYLVSDDDFIKIVAIIRLMCPYTGSILTAREAYPIRRRAIKQGGVSQMDAGTRVGVGGYAEMEKEHLPHKEQFYVKDSQSLDDFIYHLCEDGYLPSFCTAGYREGRTGENFMPLAKHATVKNLCIANGILTFKEYVLDYASDKVKKIGENKTIPLFLDWIQTHVPAIYPHVREYLKREENNTRDLHF